MEQNTKNDLLHINSIIVVPLIVEKRVLGVLSLCHRDYGKSFTDTDFAYVRSFAEFTAVSLDNLMTYLELVEKREIEREVGIAAAIQQKLLPAKTPNIGKSAVSAYSIPAKGVSGDYYDVIPISKQKAALVICDVAGKGIPASLVMIMIRTIVRLIATSTRDAATIVGWINRGITDKIDIDHFATLSYLIYESSGGKISYCNAGHHPLVVYRNRNGTIETFDTEGLPIGIEAAGKYDSMEITLEHGDIVLLYTDGIVEAMDAGGNQFGYEALINILVQNAGHSSKEIAQIIRNNLQTFIGKAKQHDDQTLLVLKQT